MSPTQAKRPCPRMGQGCPHLQPCPVHGARASDYGRQSAASRGYGTHHQAWRRSVLQRDPECLGCHALGHASDHADHVIPLREWERNEAAARVSLAIELVRRGLSFEPEDLGAWSLLNGQRLCARCHAIKTRGEGGGA